MKLKTLCTLTVAMLTFALTLKAQNNIVTYQGRVTDNGTNFSGTGLFKFALVTSTNTSHTATATASLTGNFVTSYTVTSGGSGYSVAPAVSISGGGGSGATATANISGGVVTSIAPGLAGTGYTSPPTVTLAAPAANTTYVTYWSNDGTSVAGSEPVAAVAGSVVTGLFTLGLGDTNLANMTALSAAYFLQPNLQLRIWFNDGANGSVALSPIQNVTTAPYAAFATTAGSLAAGLRIQTNPSGAQNVIEGSFNNFILNSAVGATIGGGGSTNYGGLPYTNSVNADFGTISGGMGNTIQAGSVAAAVGGGWLNQIQVNGSYNVIAGGSQNVISNSATYASIGGGSGNRIGNSSGYAVIAGGAGNSTLANTLGGAIPGGLNNVVGGSYSLAAGFNAQATNSGAFVWADSQSPVFGSTTANQFSVRASGGVRLVTGGAGLTLDGQPVLAGGTNGIASVGLQIQPNASNGAPNVVEGSSVNSVSAGVIGATIGGGGASNYFGSAFTNSVKGDFGTVGGGGRNVAGGADSTVSGGFGNIANGLYAAIPGGQLNQASGDWSFAAGYSGKATNSGAMALGMNNRAYGYASAAIGNNTLATGYAAIAIGDSANATADDSTALGYASTAAGTYSLAAGQQAQALHQGTFVWADSQNSSFASTANNQFLIRAGGGVGINTANSVENSLCVNTNTYEFSHIIYLRGESGSDHNHGLAYCGPGVTNFTASVLPDGPVLWGFGGGALGVVNGGSHAVLTWTNGGVSVNGGFAFSSDRALKTGFDRLNAQEILARVAGLPVGSWFYKTDTGARHVGPMAQDFHAAFQLGGDDDRHINVGDESGVALAAIQGLNQKLTEELKRRDVENADLKARLEKLERLMSEKTGGAK